MDETKQKGPLFDIGGGSEVSRFVNILYSADKKVDPDKHRSRLVYYATKVRGYFESAAERVHNYVRYYLPDPNSKKFPDNQS